MGAVWLASGHLPLGVVRAGVGLIVTAAPGGVGLEMLEPREDQHLEIYISNVIMSDIFYYEIKIFVNATQDFPGGSVVKNLPANAQDAGSVSQFRRSPGEGNSNTLEYTCLGNPMDRGAWRATVFGVTKVGHDWVTKRWQLILPSR